MSEGNDIALQVEDVNFRYSKDAPLALHDINLTIRRGEFVAMVGQNGAGKTTLAKHFNGLLHPTQGRVLVDGKDTRDASVEVLAKLVGYCYQNPDHQIFATTARKEVAFGPKNLGMGKDAVEEAVTKALQLVGLEDKADLAPYMLGRGERQKLAVASILAMDSTVLVVDEPTTGMDLRASRSIMALLQQWHAAGKTIIVITHDMNIVAEYVPETVVMARGRILVKQPTREVMQNEQLLAEAFLRAPQVTRIAQRLAPYGIQPDVLTVSEMINELDAHLSKHNQPTAPAPVTSGE